MKDLKKPKKPRINKELKIIGTKLDVQKIIKGMVERYGASTTVSNFLDAFEREKVVLQ